MTRATNATAARELRNTIQHLLDTTYARGTVQFRQRPIHANDSAGLAIVLGEEYLELHIYANLEEENDDH